jgi:glucose 1-dehydrogenase
MKLPDKVAIVTGASKGIGRATALELARNGAHVVVNYASSRKLAEEVAADIRGQGRQALPCEADVGDRRAVERMFETTIAEFGRLDILVNNAAFSIRKPLLDLDVADVERTWSVSLWGVFHCSQLAARQMVKQGGGGSIVVVSSVHSFRPYPTSTAYNGAKAAVNQMAYTWAVELAPHRIRVNVLEPGWTDTPGERRFATEEELREGAATVPVGRLARPEEMAKGVLFLVSDEDSSYMTGGCLRVDGGYSLIH